MSGASASLSMQRIFAAVALASGLMTLLAALEVHRVVLLAGVVLSASAGLAVALSPRRHALEGPGRAQRALPPRVEP